MAYSKRHNPLGLTPIPILALLREDPSPPSGALINVILEYADIQYEAGGGRVVLRLSQRRIKDPVIKSILGREAKRLLDISILWDEEEGEIISVRDAAAGTDAPLLAATPLDELDTFELTEAALAYIEASKRRRK
jgi:hypothetical protein